MRSKISNANNQLNVQFEELKTKFINRTGPNLPFSQKEPRKEINVKGEYDGQFIYRDWLQDIGPSYDSIYFN
jgi:hypothetical protein